MTKTNRRNSAWATTGQTTAQFDAELRRLLAPHATDGAVDFTVRATLTFGKPRP